LGADPFPDDPERAVVLLVRLAAAAGLADPPDRPLDDLGLCADFCLVWAILASFSLVVAG
jgi:hypothetical protein